MPDQKISALTNYTTPLDADVIPVVDTANTTTKKTTWANIKATLKTYLDTLYQAILVSGTNIKTVNSTSLLGSGNISITGGFSFGVKAYRATSVQSIATSTTTKIQLNGEDWDFANEFDSTTNFRYTATTAGYYIVSFAAQFATTESGKYYAIFPILNAGNGIGLSEVQSSSTSEITPSGSTMVHLSIGDFIELYLFHNSATSKNINIADGVTYMTVQRIL